MDMYACTVAGHDYRFSLIDSLIDSLRTQAAPESRFVPRPSQCHVTIGSHPTPVSANANGKSPREAASRMELPCSRF
jgi:hypothetical protein